MSFQIENWDSNAVANWLLSNGYGSYEKRFRENDITGEVLLNADHEMLKELKIKSVGHRLALLKAIKQLKEEQGYEGINDENGDKANIKKLEHNLNEKIQHLTEELNDLRQNFDQLQFEFKTLQKSKSKKGSFIDPIAKLRTNTGTSYASSTRDYSDDDSYRSEVRSMAHKEKGAIKVYAHKTLNHENESYKSILVSLQDNCSYILPIVLKKWKIKEDWKNFALFMHFKGQDQCLSYDDRPLALLHQLRTSTESPVFVLGSIRRTEQDKIQDKNQRNSVHMPNNRISSLRPISMLKTPDEEIEQPNPEEPLAETEKELAVAIYEYKAERDDELNVNIGDQFKVLDKTTTGWWVVEKDGKTGWVPSSCLLDNQQSSEKETQEKNEEDDEFSTGVVLYDYNAIGVNELTIHRGEQLQILKKFQHWLLADCNGKQGWVPSCYIKIGNGSEADLSENEDYYHTDDQLESPLHENAEEKETQLENKKEIEPAELINQIPASAIKAINQMSAGSLKGSLNSPAVSKLDSLMDLFNPFLTDEEQIQNKTTKTTSPTKLQTLLDEISNNLTDMQTSEVPESPATKEILSKPATTSPIPPIRLMTRASSEKLSKYESELLQQKQYEIIPYAELVKREKIDLDLDHLEQYLNEEECMKYLGCTREELKKMPQWQLNQRKRRANLL